MEIRQIVLAARDLNSTVAQLQSVLGVDVCYHDPEVNKFGLHNALMPIGHEGHVQFLEVVSPIQDNTTAGRHLDRHGDSGYMLILQTNDLTNDRIRLGRLGVRIVWDVTLEDISAVHLHPKDIGGAIVSIDQPVPPASWRWAGPDWKKHTRKTGAQRVTATTIAAQDPSATASRWSSVLGMNAPTGPQAAPQIDIDKGCLKFEAGKDVISAFTLTIADKRAALEEASKQGLPIDGTTVTICGTRFELNG
jgi:hypothetical protein